MLLLLLLVAQSPLLAHKVITTAHVLTRAAVLMTAVTTAVTVVMKDSSDGRGHSFPKHSL